MQNKLAGPNDLPPEYNANSAKLLTTMGMTPDRLNYALNHAKQQHTRAWPALVVPLPAALPGKRWRLSTGSRKTRERVPKRLSRWRRTSSRIPAKLGLTSTSRSRKPTWITHRWVAVVVNQTTRYGPKWIPLPVRLTVENSRPQPRQCPASWVRRQQAPCETLGAQYRHPIWLPAWEPRHAPPCAGHRLPAARIRKALNWLTRKVHRVWLSGSWTTPSSATG